MGWIPRAARKDELVNTTAGSTLPVILRRLGDDFQVVGTCYIHGIMDGVRMESVHIPVRQIRIIWHPAVTFFQPVSTTFYGTSNFRSTQLVLWARTRCFRLLSSRAFKPRVGCSRKYQRYFPCAFLLFKLLPTLSWPYHIQAACMAASPSQWTNVGVFGKFN